MQAPMEGEEEMAPIVVDQSKVKNFTVKKLLYIIFYLVDTNYAPLSPDVKTPLKK